MAKLWTFASEVNVRPFKSVQIFMKTAWTKKAYKGLVLLSLVGATVAFVGCADTYYAGYPGYRGGYYASYSGGYPYYGAYGYGYGYPYRAYGPYYGGPYYGYGSPYYGGARIVYSGSRTYTYRDQYGRLHTTRRANRVRNNQEITNTRRTERTTRATRAPRTRVPVDQNDDENRYYSRP